MFFINSEMPMTLFAPNETSFDLKLIEVFRKLLTYMERKKKNLPPDSLQRMYLTTSSMELDMYL